ncbi:triple functional domain protein-like isoform X2 [Paramacrobiotus metropolitanus]|uniref:triple functional domain protein-like isoform X2 n=1 Tax=Paramacrobiotus metropolitanus TaxID=2943436 RepID=UPI0024464E10|nr:triple functional domain protein-like isoform X2 [Paramacrobiotus metropolitanus]
MHGIANHQYSMAKSNASGLLRLLRERLAFLSGGRDRQGGAIITFPASSSVLEDVRTDDLRQLMAYLTGIPSEEVRRHGFTIIVDLRKSHSSGKALLKAFQETFGCPIRTVFVIKPDSTKAKSTQSSSKFPFEVLWISVDQLPKYINTSQLTTDLGGSLFYNHNEWVELKAIIDDFIDKTTKKLDNSEQLKRSLLNADLANDLVTADNMLKEHDKLRKKIKDQNFIPVEEMEEEGHRILSRLSSRTDPYDAAHPASINSSLSSIAQNPDFQPLLNNVRILLERLHGIRAQLYHACQQRQEKLEHCRQLRLFEQQAEKMLERMNSSRQQFLLNYTEIGTSYSAVKGLQDRFEQLQMDCLNMFVDVDRILDIGGRLVDSGHYAAQVVKLVANKLDREKKAIGTGLKDRANILSLSATFHRKAEDFAKNAPSWAAACQIENLPNESAALEKLIDQHDFVAKSIGQAYTEVHSCSKELMHHLNRLIMFCRRALSDYCTTDGKAVLDTLHGSSDASSRDQVVSKADYTREAAHILDVIRNILAHYRQLQQLCDAKKAHLENYWALRLFQDDVRQVIDWINTWGDPFLQKTCEVGKSHLRAKKLRDSHIEFEGVAQNTYTNAAKLLEAARRLIQKGGQNIDEVRNSSLDLEKQTKEFAGRVSARRTMLDTAVAFYDHLSNLTSCLEQAKKSVRADLPVDSLESVVEGLNRLSNERQAVMECCTHTDREGYALLSQLRDASMLESVDYNHIEHTLKIIASNREELDAAWEPRRIVLDLYLKLRMFERSASEVASDVDSWVDSIQENDLDIDAPHAKQEFSDLDTRVDQLLALSQQAYARGQELTQYLSNFPQVNMVDLSHIKQRVASLLDFLVERQSDIPAVAEIYRIRLQNVVQLNQCNEQAQEILSFVHAKECALKSLPLTLKSLNESEMLLRCHDKVRSEIDSARPVLTKFQDLAENIAQNDIDGAEVAHRLMENVNSQWQQLLCNTEEIHRAMSSGVTFYRAADQVRAVLGALHNEYGHDEDWCGGDKSQRVDKMQWIAKLTSRHQEQKEAFMKACTHVRRTGETFLKCLARVVGQHMYADILELHATEGVRAILSHVQNLEDGVLQLWTRRKKRLDHCQRYIDVERSAKQALAWIQDTGELYLSTRTTVGTTQAATEALLNEHNDFLGTAKENKEKIRKLMQLADSLVENGHSHATSIKSWVSAVDVRQKDFMSRMEHYQRQLEQKLGVVLHGREAHNDRHSDASLEGKLHEFSAKDAPVENRKLLREREGAMAELLLTEKAYVKDLADCIKYYLNEIKNPTSAVNRPVGLLAKIPVIFANIEEIYEFHCNVFLKELEKYESVPEDVAHCFMTWSHRFEIYVTYCMNNRQAQSVIAEPVIRDYFAEVGAQFGLNSSSTMNSYIIKPVQRTVKYGQLLERLALCCEDVRGEIRDALDVVRSVTQKANDASNLSLMEGYTEPLDKLGEIILVDSLQVWEPKQIIRKGRKYQVFLFERAILFTKEIKDANGQKKFVFKNKYMTAGMTIHEHVEGGEDCKFAIWMGRASGTASQSQSTAGLLLSDSKIILKASTVPVKLSWIQKLREITVQDNNCVAAVDTAPSSNSSLLPTLMNGGTSQKESSARNSRGSKDYEDSLSLEEGSSGHHERYSTISHSSSNTTDSSDKVLYEGDWATITENYEAIHDGELTVQKGECVEVLDRSSSADTYYVRLRIAPSTSGYKSGLAAQKIIEGYLPANILALVPNNRSARQLSPSKTMPIDFNPHGEAAPGSGTNIPLQSSTSGASQAAGHTGNVSDSHSQATQPAPTSKRRNTFRKWLTNPVRKLSQNRIEMGASTAGKSHSNPNSTAVVGASSAAAVPVNLHSGVNSLSSVPPVAVGHKKPPTASTVGTSAARDGTAASAATAVVTSSSTASFSSVTKTTAQSRTKVSTQHNNAVQIQVQPDDIRRGTVAPPLAQQEVWHDADAAASVTASAVQTDYDHHLALISKPTSTEDPTIEQAVGGAPVVNLINTDTPADNDNTGPAPPEMPPPMEHIHSIPALNTLNHTSSPAAAGGAQESLPFSSSSAPSLLSSSASPTDSHSTVITVNNTATDPLSIHPQGSELANQIENLVVNSTAPTALPPMSARGDPSKLAAATDHQPPIGTASPTSPANMSPAQSSASVLERTDRSNLDVGKSDNPEDSSCQAQPDSSAPSAVAPVEETVPETLDPISRAVTMRDYVLKELVDTERDYVKDLGLIIDGYIAYMHENAMPDDMNGRDKLIFGNIQQIYVFHKDTFCGELEKCLDAADRLPRVFIKHERKFQHYVVYCQNKPKSEFIVSEYIDTYFEDIRLKLGHKLKLPDMLIKPVQRVMRYQLMLKDILKYTERAQLPAEELRKALNCIMGICKLANDFMEVGRLQGFEGKLTAQGKLLLQDSFMVCETVTAAAPSSQGKDKEKEKDKDKDPSQPNKFKERQIFLFEQVVIFSEAVGGTHKKPYSSPVYLYKSHIQVNKMSLIEVEKDVVRFALRSRCPHSGDRMFVIEAPDKEKRDLWVAQIKTMLDTQQNFLRALQSPIDFQRRAQQGDDAMGSTDPTHPSPPTEPALLPPQPLSTKPPLRLSERSEVKLPKFLRPKSYTEDRRKTAPVPHIASDAPPARSVGYSGAFTGPISPSHTLPHSNPDSSNVRQEKFLFPSAGLVKSVHSEADLLKSDTKGNERNSASMGMPPKASPAESLTNLQVASASSSPKSGIRRWSISGRRDRDKSPAARPSLPVVQPPSQIPQSAKESRNSLSFRRKN